MDIGGSSGPMIKCSSISTARCGNSGATIPESVLEAAYYCPNNPDTCDTTTYQTGPGYSDTDLVIYVTGDADPYGCDNNTMGYSGSCQSNLYDRPIAGYINLCRDSIDFQSVLTWEQSVAVIIHQSFHVLGVCILCEYGQISKIIHYLRRFQC